MHYFSVTIDLSQMFICLSPLIKNYVGLVVGHLWRKWWLLVSYPVNQVSRTDLLDIWQNSVEIGIKHQTNIQTNQISYSHVSPGIYYVIKVHDKYLVAECMHLYIYKIITILMMKTFKDKLFPYRIKHYVQGQRVIKIAW